jgi:hypothetical protein
LIECNGKSCGVAVLREIKISALNDFITFLDTGYNVNETVKLLQKMYEELRADGLLKDDSIAFISGLSFPDFISDLKCLINNFRDERYSKIDELCSLCQTTTGFKPAKHGRRFGHINHGLFKNGTWIEQCFFFQIRANCEMSGN